MQAESRSVYLFRNGRSIQTQQDALDLADKRRIQPTAITVLKEALKPAVPKASDHS